MYGSQSPPKWVAYPPRPPLCWEQVDNPGRALPGTARPQSEASQEPRAPSRRSARWQEGWHCLGTDIKEGCLWEAPSSYNLQ